MVSTTKQVARRLDRGIRQLIGRAAGFCLAVLGVWLLWLGWGQWQTADRQAALRHTGLATAADVVTVDAAPQTGAMDVPAAHSISYRYAVEEREYLHRARSMRPFPLASGDSLAVWVDPATPAMHLPDLPDSDAVMSHERARWVLLAGGFCVFIAIGTAAGALNRTAPDTAAATGSAETSA